MNDSDSSTLTPQATFKTPLKLNSTNKSFVSATGVLVRQVSSSAGFVVLSVGTGSDVPRANFFYIRGRGNFQLRLTQDDGAGGTTVATLQCNGLFVAEFPETLALTQAEVSGSGAFEYLASGIV